MIVTLLKDKKIIIIFLITLLVIIIIGLSLFQNQPDNSSSTTSPNTSKLSDMDKPLKVVDIPRISSTNGGGLDTNSPELKGSIEQVNKLKSNIPYQNIFVTSEGIEVEVFIPPADLQENEWTLTVHVFGIDYQIPEESEDYDTMRLSFLEATTDALQFIENHDVDIDKLLIKWGDRSFIQDRAQEWLNSIDS